MLCECGTHFLLLDYNRWRQIKLQGGKQDAILKDDTVEIFFEIENQQMPSHHLVYNYIE